MSVRVVSKPLDLPPGALRRGERGRFDHAGFPPGRANFLRPDSLELVQELLGLLFLPQFHQGAPQMQQDVGIVRRDSKSPAKYFLGVGRAVQRTVSQAKLIERTEIPRIDFHCLLKIGYGLGRTSEPIEQPGAIDVSRRESRVQAHRLCQLLEGLLGMLAP